MQVLTNANATADAAVLHTEPWPHQGSEAAACSVCLVYERQTTTQSNDPATCRRGPDRNKGGHALASPNPCTGCEDHTTAASRMG